VLWYLVSVSSFNIVLGFFIALGAFAAAGATALRLYLKRLFSRLRPNGVPYIMDKLSLLF